MQRGTVHNSLSQRIVGMRSLNWIRKLLSTRKNRASSNHEIALIPVTLFPAGVAYARKERQ